MQNDSVRKRLRFFHWDGGVVGVPDVDAQLLPPFARDLFGDEAEGVAEIFDARMSGRFAYGKRGFPYPPNGASGGALSSLTKWRGRSMVKMQPESGAGLLRIRRVPPLASTPRLAIESPKPKPLLS